MNFEQNVDFCAEIQIWKKKIQKKSKIFLEHWEKIRKYFLKNLKNGPKIIF